ncbi:LysR family transcriptional regulator [Roseiterribacter gracilis]|uniref:LysR family transcriptional regulator n=1 Tax=Roseiterribacter gracilis TaxID=2812848 RepID=A0A8S8X5V5_9PROT|nr:LysR family transcriptional regulator [Rhodospirillales bacterium TMPK1]
MSLGFDDVAIFVRVARGGSFVAAARALDLPTSTISRRIAQLEARLGVQLLRRTTRAVSLTDDGRAFADRCGVAFDEIATAADNLRETGEVLRGTLRVTAPPFVCPDTFAPSLLEFAARHPELVLDLHFTNAAPDLVEEGVDLAFQLGPLRDGRHVARKLWAIPHVLCASPALLAQRPALLQLTHPRQLADHPCVVTPPMKVWSFERDKDEVSLTPRTLGATISDMALAEKAVRQGLGLGYLPSTLVDGALKDGTLVRIELDGWTPDTRDFFAVYPASRQLSPKVRAAIDHAVAGRTAHL